MNRLENILSDVHSIDQNLDYLIEIIPEIKYMIGFDQMHPHHHLDLWNHTKLAIRIASDDFEVKLALLLHDIGKPFSYTEKDGIRHYKNHGEISSKISIKILERLNYNKDFIDEVCYLIRNHDNPITKEDIEANYELELKRLEIQKCDSLAHNPLYLDKRIKYLEKTKKLF